PHGHVTALQTCTPPIFFTVAVTVKDTAGQASTATTQVTVNPPDAPPAAALSVSPSSGTAPLPVTADASASTDTDSTPITTYKFEIGRASCRDRVQAAAP